MNVIICNSVYYAKGSTSEQIQPFRDHTILLVFCTYSFGGLVHRGFWVRYVDVVLKGDPAVKTNSNKGLGEQDMQVFVNNLTAFLC